jgi:hypothetical protein
MRKQEIKKCVVRYLVNEEIFDENPLSLIFETYPDLNLNIYYN